ncbi:MipA/OmpV family protein [Litoribacillus peritrichatus]|uniref:MipA/OmpV family protein n=1 Tax=Litoribacillus peritrichatus TaxID=718191 RepID=UPI0031DDE341
MFHLTAKADDFRILSLDLPENVWALGFAQTLRTSVYEGESTDQDLLPVFAYKGKHGYILGPEAGLHLYKDSDWRVDLFAAYRFSGFDKDENSALEGMSADDSLDGGIKFFWQRGDFEAIASWRMDVSERHEGDEAQFEFGYLFTSESWKLRPWIGAKWQNSDLVNYYFGVSEKEATPDREETVLSDHWQAGLGIDTSYRVDNNSVFSFSLSEMRLDTDIAHSSIVEEQYMFKAILSYQYQFVEGSGGSSVDFSNDFFEGDWFYRVAGGLATEESFNKIIRGRINFEERNTGITSVFVGKKLTDEFFSLPIEIYLKGGLVRHFEQGTQPDFWEYVTAFKGYYSGFPWSDRIETRLGFAEGVSYVERIPIIELENVESKNPSASHLLNYLDFSIDVNLGDVFSKPSWKSCYGGFSIHHRSGIFASADAFGNVDGGSNYNTLYIECQFENKL